MCSFERMVDLVWINSGASFQCLWVLFAVNLSINCLVLLQLIGQNGSGPTVAVAEPMLANWSAVSFPWIPEWPGTHASVT